MSGEINPQIKPMQLCAVCSEARNSFIILIFFSFIFFKINVRNIQKHEYGSSFLTLETCICDKIINTRFTYCILFQSSWPALEEKLWDTVETSEKKFLFLFVLHLQLCSFGSLSLKYARFLDYLFDYIWEWSRNN